MEEEALREREVCISNFLSIMPDYVKARSVSDGQCDVIITRKDGTRFRYGYFDRWTFWRENPVQRVLREHGISVSEGSVNFLSEPQYDMVIDFSDRYGTIRHLSDSRTQYEVDYNYERFMDIHERIGNLLRFRESRDDDKTIDEISALLSFYEKARDEAIKKENAKKAHQKFERYIVFDETKFYTYCVDGETVNFESGEVCPKCGVTLTERKE